MKIGVLGTSMVGKTVADKLVSLGHSVKVGTRDVKATLARNEHDMAGGPPIRTWLEAHPTATLGTFAEAAQHGELIVNALSGQGALEGLKAAGEANLAGKILIDISNPLDFSKGMPPTLSVCNTESLGEQIQRAYPKTKVVKTLNTVNAFLMVDPAKLAGGDHTMFMAGNDPGAKEQVLGILKTWFGWKDVIDLGDISQARGTEMYLPLWVRLYGKLQNPMFSIKVVR